MVLMRPVSPKARAVAFSASVLAGIVVILAATFVWPGYTTHPTYDNLFVIAIMIILLPPAMVDLMDRRYRTAVNSRIPDFLRDIAESQKTGMSFTKALEHSARLKLGALSKELGKTVAMLTWGIPYDDALEAMGRRVGTPLMRRTVTILNEVGKSGGHLYEILDGVHAHVREIHDLEKERKRQISPYVAIIYAADGVYLFVVLILFTTFFAQLKGLAQSGTPFGSGINPEVFYVWFFHMSIVEAVIGGFMCGKMSAGSSSAGMLHVLILLAISLVLFVFFIPF